MSFDKLLCNPKQTCANALRLRKTLKAAAGCVKRVAALSASILW